MNNNNDDDDNSWICNRDNDSGNNSMPTISQDHIR